MAKNYFWCILILLLVQASIYAQVSFIEYPQVCDFVFTDENGLIYLSSTRGLYVFDGDGKPKKVKLNGIDNSNIQSSLYPDTNHALWFSTYNRIVRYDTKNGTTESYQAVVSTTDTLFSNYYIFDIDDDRTTFWIKINKRIYEHNTISRETKLVVESINGKRIVSSRLSDAIVLLDYYYTDKPSIVFMENGKYSRSEWINWPSKCMVNEIINVDANNVLMGTNGGLLLGDIRRRQVHSLSFKVFENGILAIGKYVDNSWIVSTKDGILYKLSLDISTNTYLAKIFRLFPAPERINRILRNEQGTIFLSSYTQGIYYFNPENIKFSNYYEDSFDDLNMNKINSNIVAKTWRETEITASGVPFISNKNISLQSFSPYKQSILNETIILNHPDSAQLYRYYKDYNGNLYASFLDTSLYSFDKDTWNKVITPKVIDSYVNFYFSMGDSFHLASVDQEKIVTWNTYRIDQAKVKIFSGDVFSAIYSEDENSIYLATEQGLLLYSFNSHLFSLIDSNSTLPCFCLVNDRNANIWYSSINQIFMYSPKSRSLKYYDIADGSRSYSIRKCDKISPDSLLFYHAEGVTLIEPSKIELNHSKSYVNLANYKINDVVVPHGSIYNIENQIEHEYANNTISFDLMSNDLLDATNTRIKYMLNGYDQDWVYSEGNSAFVRYPRLPPGSYLFTVFGANSDGIWNTSPREILITIHPPFWLTWWFIALSTIALISLFYLAIRSYYRRKLEKKNQLLREQSLIIEKQQAVEHERTRIASEMHDDLGAGLTTIRYLSDKALTQAKDAEEAIQIKKIADHSNALVRNMSEIIWAMNSRFDNAENLIGYLRRYASEYLEEHHLPLKFIIADDHLQEISIGGEKRRNLFLVFKEVLHNTVKYSNAERVEIKVNTGDQILITISEIGGKGFDPAISSEKGNGIYNCNKRMSGIQGHIAFEKSDESMNIIISAPINA